MRSSSVISIILMVGLVFTIFGLIITDMQRYYEDDIDNSSWSGFYDEEYTTDINESATKLQTSFQNIGDEDSWFKKLGLGVVAIHNSVLETFTIIISSMVIGGKIFTESGVIFGIPKSVMLFGTVALIVTIVFSLLNWWHSKTQI